MNAQAIGKRIDELRKERGQSKRFLAKKLGISYSSCCKYIYGLRIPGDETKMRISDYFGIGIEDLFYADKNSET